LKPFRPDSLFEMAVLAVTEQQISTKAAHSIQKRLLERFGREVDGLPLFPSAETLAEASSESLRDIGLSGRKTEYIQGLARQTASGEFDLQALCGLGNDEVRRRISGLRGFGRWSADYILVRGLGRPDVVPADDLGIQKIVGAYFAGGARLTARQVTETLAPYRPWRGLAVFYLAADHIRKED
jgi:DNA-3-methyladenine glycosylase II